MKVLFSENISGKMLWFHRNTAPIIIWDVKKQLNGFYKGLHLLFNPEKFLIR
jgi:hypothetical protein